MLNLRSNRTPWSNFPKGHPSSHYSSPSTLDFRVLSNPSNSSLHRHLLIYLAYQSYYTLLMSRTLFMFMTMMKFWKIFQTSRSYYVSYFEKKFQIFFEWNIDESSKCLQKFIMKSHSCKRDKRKTNSASKMLLKVAFSEYRFCFFCHAF